MTTLGESVIRAAAERVVHKRRCVNGVMLYDGKAADAIGGVLVEKPPSDRFVQIADEIFCFSSN
ncbi:hypothetical protein MY10362_008821, partial [Beauveria mimosiformis]